MKLSSRDAPGYFARPDSDKMGLLIYGGDAMRIALKRQEVIAGLVAVSYTHLTLPTICSV